MGLATRGRVLALGIELSLLALVGAASVRAGDSKPGVKKLDLKSTPTLKVDETVGHLANVQATGETPVQGVGLVVGLDMTGADPAPSMYRQKLLDQMRKARVPQAEKILASRTTSLVLVKAKIPPGISPRDTFDVELELAPNSATTSLENGFLLLTDLHQIGIAKGAELEGQLLASAYGPVMIDPANPKVGRVLGAARVKKEVPYTMAMNERRRNIKTAALVQVVINQRFNQLEGIDQQGMASAKTEEYLTLKVPRNYHHNQFRYFQVVENLPVVDNEVLRGQRMAAWSKELLDPKTAGAAALRLEGMGRNSLNALKAGLKSENAQVRFFAAEALAYLNDETGVDVLSNAAIQFPQFRAQALAALAALDQPAASIRLSELMSHADAEVRYGAFDALRVQDESSAYLGRVRVLRAEPEPEPDGGDAMALQIASGPRRKAARPRDPFDLYIVDCEGPPMIHVANTRRCEIVVFGRQQELLTPAVLGKGSILINAAQNDEKVQVSRIASTSDGGDQKLACPLQIGEIIREAANLGASYPEVLSLLRDAEKHKNLPGPLIVDAVPQASDLYDQAQYAGTDTTVKKDPALTRASAESKSARKNLFSRLRDRIGTKRK